MCAILQALVLHAVQIASLAAFCYGLITLLLVIRRSDRAVERQDILHTMAWIFIASLLYDWSHAEYSILTFLYSLFHAIQMATGNFDYQLTENGDILSRINDYYGLILVIAAPTSTIALVVTYMSDLLSAPFIRFRSRWSDTFVFAQLDTHSLMLAESVVSFYRTHELGDTQSDEEPDKLSSRPFIVFADVDNDAEEDLVSSVRAMGAFCTSHDIEEVARWSSERRSCLSRLLTRQTFVTLLATSADEGLNISLAKRLDCQANQMLACCKNRFRIFALTSLRNSETLLFEERLFEKKEEQATDAKKGTAADKDVDGADRNRVIVRGFDNTRGAIEHVIDCYPVFLTYNPHSPWLEGSKNSGGGKGPDAGQCHLDANLQARWVRELLGSPDCPIINRHIVIVGAGALGLEFAGSALWASRIDGVHTRIDVLDKEENPAFPGTTMAESRFAANSPEILKFMGTDADSGPDDDLGRYDLGFTLIDAEGEAYQQFLEQHEATITYVFIALGDDMLNAKVAMRTRRTLERKLIRRLASTSAEVGSCRNAVRPLLVTFIENDELAGIVEGAHYEGQPCDIICVGRNAESFAYEQLVAAKKNKDPEYNRRSSQASKAHTKCRLFAYLRHLWTRQPDVLLKDGEHLSADHILNMVANIDWMHDLDQTQEAVRRYNRYCISQAAIDAYNEDADKKHEHSRTEVQAQSCALRSEAKDGMPSREWLLRMEHERWNAYIRVEGFEVADGCETTTLFNTGQKANGKNLHRSNLAGLHPCLTRFEQLGETHRHVTSLYNHDGIPKSLRPEKFMMQDDNYLVIGSKSDFFEQEAQMRQC